ncbi:serine hydrolase FSH [Biscogniauxia mediterranea]|nr:serine hydrolase FSH [Biscogniauxia mediterranea]
MGLVTATEDATLSLPRILCLHGGGTNARIFRAQCRRLTVQLQSEFRLVFAQAPFNSNAGPDVISVYGQWGPFKRWLRWKPEHPAARPEDIVYEIDQSLEEAMQQDDAQGATGEWVALLGFSQGAKVAASLLYRQQLREEFLGQPGIGNSKFRFGVLLAGRAPLISLDPSMAVTSDLPDASQSTDVVALNKRALGHKRHVLRIPTIHVHGLQDKGMDMHRQLFDEFCDPETRRIIEWDGDHRVPLKLKDVSPVVYQIRELAKETGVFRNYVL